MLRLVFLLGFLLILESSIAQGQLAQIKDRYGFVKVQKGRGIDSTVVDTIKTGEIFPCFSEGDWIKVHRKDTQSTGEFDGYVHKKRIEFFDGLPEDRKQLLFQKIFIERKELVGRASEAYRQNEPINKEDQKEFDKGLLSSYALLVQKFSHHFCKTKDEETMGIFLETLWADSDSKNEAPLFEMSTCFICEPDLVLNVISKSKSSKKRQYLYQSIEWGMMNQLKEKDPHSLKLKKKLEQALKAK